MRGGKKYYSICPLFVIINQRCYNTCTTLKLKALCCEEEFTKKYKNKQINCSMYNDVQWFTNSWVKNVVTELAMFLLLCSTITTIFIVLILPQKKLQNRKKLRIKLEY